MDERTLASPEGELKTERESAGRKAVRLARSLAGIRELGLLLILVALCMYFQRASSTFLEWENILSTIVPAFTHIAIMAIGVTFVILTGGIDLSVGSVIGLSGCVAVLAMTQYHLSVVPGALVGLGVGLAAGLVNGILVAGAKLPPFIATLGIMSAARSLAYVITGGNPSYPPENYLLLDSTRIFGIPLPIFVLIGLTAICWLILSRTSFGRRIYAVGGNEQAARLSGVPVERVKLAAYVLSGLLTGIAALLMVANYQVAAANGGEGYELDAIAAAVIGGTSLSGGEGTILGTVFGAAIMGVLRMGLVAAGIDASWHKFIIGSAIVVAGLVDVLRNRRRRRA